MATQKAVIVTSFEHEGLVTDRAIPALRDDYILVKVEAVALNPTDWKHVKFLSPPGSLVGCDYAGIVQKIGKNVKKLFKEGDRVCGFVHGGNALQPDDGAFAEYIVAKGDIQMHIPDNLSFQEAATLGVGITTVGQALYQSLKLALPATLESPQTANPLEPAETLLIYGGSTATGALAIQFAKLSGYTVLTTCSPHNFEQVKSLGADKVFDYNAPDAAAEIRAYTHNKLKLAFDTISIDASARLCDAALSTEGGDYTALLAVGIDRVNINDRWTLAYSAIGEEYMYRGTPLPSKPEDKEFAVMFWSIAERLLADGKVKVHTPKVNPGGLNGVIDGLQLLRDNKVSGEKLVYNLSGSS
ncbi:Protein TOXD [Penicillium robsamsonii]|uniref:Protein TOXD n=1 Tax=Penicillium robsamsonii TaxID=1792511 RepID=UPI0025487FB9|nr:Protein TOXD [Penicillium robsamsonii]KAJ5827401.1 Protein TOXD [Penicillium robsamsonii]